MKLFRKIVNVGNGLEIELPLIRSFIPQPPILYILHISFSLFILIYSREKNSNHTHLELLSLWCLISCESGNYLKVIRSINKWKVLLLRHSCIESLICGTTTLEYLESNICEYPGGIVNIRVILKSQTHSVCLHNLPHFARELNLHF